MSVEEKLAEYRRRKEQKLNENKLKTSVASTLSFVRRVQTDEQVHPPVATANLKTEDLVEENICQDEEVPSSSGDIPPVVEANVSRRLQISSLVLKVLLWACLMTLFVHIEFGAVYFVCSVFYLIFTNFHSGPKKAGAPSAYSVFNPNCESIDGTLTAEQFERELKFGPLRR